MIRKTFVRITDRDIEAIRNSYYDGTLKLPSYRSERTTASAYQPSNLQYLNLKRVLETYFLERAALLGGAIAFVDKEVQEAAIKLSSSLKNSRGDYAPVVVGFRERNIKHYYFKGDSFDEVVFSGKHDFFGPPQSLADDVVVRKRTEEFLSLEADILGKKLDNHSKKQK